MDPTERRPWSGLPLEILSMIGSRLDARMDVLCFRSICSSFRSSIPAPRREATSRFPLRIQPDLSLRVSTVYALETPDGGASGGRARWLLKLEESEPRHMRILSLFSQRRIAYLLHKFPKVLDSLRFRMVEICRLYTLDYGGRTESRFPDVQKVVMHPDGVGSDLDQCSVYFIDGDGRVGYWKYGDESWRRLEYPRGSGYGDIAVYQGKVYVVDWSGSVSQIDSSFRLQSFSLPIYGIGGHHRRDFSGCSKHLVVSSGDLYLVDGDKSYSGKTVISFEVYRLDQQRGRWEEVRSLGNSAFFICNLSSFAVPVRELGGGCAGNCIYHAKNCHLNFHVFSLADRSLNWLPYSDFLIGLFR